GEELRLEVGSVNPHVAEDLRARPTKLTLGQGEAALAHESLHLAAHGLEIEGGIDEGVVEVEDADGRSGRHDLSCGELTRSRCPGEGPGGARCRRGRGCDRPR